MKRLLKKWLSGATTWDEEKRLRKSAKEDAFLAEAIEGYDSFPTSDHDATIHRLKGKIGNGIQAEKTLFFYLNRVAAAAVIIGVIGSFIWVQRALEQPEILSQNSEKIQAPIAAEEMEDEGVITLEMEEEALEKANLTIAEEKETSISNQAQSVYENPPIPKTNPPSIPAASTTKPIAEAKGELFNDDAPVVKEETPTPTENIALADQASTIASSEIQTESAPISRSESYAQAEPIPEAAVQSAPTTSFSTQAKKARTKVATNSYIGSVVSEDGQPQAQVKIIGSNSTNQTITDLKGVFELKSAMPLEQITLTKDGFHPHSIELNQYSDQLNVVLVPESAKVFNESFAKTIAPIPDGGFDALTNYIKENLQYPKKAKKKGIQQKVELKFFIDDNGRLTNLKVTGRDKYGFGKEAIRLLQNGPTWQPINSYAKYLSLIHI